MKRCTFLSVLALLLIVSDVSQAVDKKIYSIADGENDPLRRYPNGTSYVMWTDYNSTSSNYRRRSVIQFDTSGVSNYTLRGAVLNLWGSSGSGSSTSSVNIYHYENDSWGESSIPYASSVGSKMGSVTVNKVSDISYAQQYEISLSNMPYMSSYDNSLSLALVAGSGDGAYFVTRNGVSWNGSANKKPFLTFRTWGETSVTDGDFSAGFGSFNLTSEGGTGQIVDNPYGDGSVLELTTGSPVGIQQVLDTPQDAFYVNFDYAFETETGLLDITLTDRDGVEFLIGQLQAGSSSVGQMRRASLYVQNPGCLYLDNATLGMQFDGVTGSQMLLDNIEFSNIPEPSTMLLLTLGGLLLRKKK